MVAVTLQGADEGDTTTLDETLCEAGMAVAQQIGRERLGPNEAPGVNVAGIEETVTDRGNHSGAVVKRMNLYAVRSYIPHNKQKGRRNWSWRHGGCTRIVAGQDAGSDFRERNALFPSTNKAGSGGFGGFGAHRLMPSE